MGQFVTSALARTGFPDKAIFSAQMHFSHPGSAARVTSGAAAALFRDLGEEQPGARDAANKSYEYRPDQDVESRVHSEDQDGACSQQQQ